MTGLPATGDARHRKIALVIDADPGIDDAVALALAVASPEVDLRAVTTVAGNAPLDVTTDNALRLLRVLGREDVPVAAGATRALVHVGLHGQRSPHGENALGDVDVPPAVRAPEARHAVDLLAGILTEAEPRSITVAAIGPLTNIALLLALHPDLADRIARLVVMGGSSGRGNITPVAEFNTWTDPEAAHRVLTDPGFEICLIGLDVTRRATVDGAALAVLRESSERGALLAAMIARYASHERDGWPLHDVLAVASVIDPTLVRTCPVSVHVDTGLGETRGQTVFGVAGAPPVQSPARFLVRPASLSVAFDVDVPRFRNLVIPRVPGEAGWRRGSYGAATG